jgi:methionyl-tRNA formyltransferase
MEIAAPKIGKESFEIHWTKQTALQVYNQYRAVSDLSKLHSTWQETNKVVRLNDIVHPAVIENMDLDRLHPDAQPGQVIVTPRKKKGCERYLCIKCLDGWTAFRQLYYGPRKVIGAADFNSGFITKNNHGDGKTFFFVSSS